MRRWWVGRGAATSSAGSGTAGGRAAKSHTAKGHTGDQDSDPARAPIQTSERGEPLSRLLTLSARSLLVAARADRAGVWLSEGRRGESAAGCVVEAEPGPIPGEWNQLDLSAPFLRAALEGLQPLRVETVAGESVEHLRPLRGMRSVVWIPLRHSGRSLAMAMVAYARPPQSLDLNLLRARA